MTRVGKNLERTTKLLGSERGMKSEEDLDHFDRTVNALFLNCTHLERSSVIKVGSSRKDSSIQCLKVGRMVDCHTNSAIAFPAMEPRIKLYHFGRWTGGLDHEELIIALSRKNTIMSLPKRDFIAYLR